MYEELTQRLRETSMDFGQLDSVSVMLLEAADAIESTNKAYQMISEAYEAEVTKQNWIPVTERLPQDEETVLTWGKQETILLDWRHDNKWCCFGNVTHWMPMPEPPKEKTE